MDPDQFKRQNIVAILRFLRFESFLKKYSPKTVVTSDSFDKLSPLQFRLICYFLFWKLDPETCQVRFRGVFPSRDIQQETEFRRLAIAYINQLAQNQIDPLIKIAQIPAIHYQRLSGHVFVEQMFNLTIYVLIKLSSNLGPFLERIKHLDSVSQAENLVRESQNYVDSFSSDLLYCEQKVDRNIKHLKKEMENLQQNTNENDRLIEKVCQSNNQLKQKLSLVCQHLEIWFSIWHNMGALMPPSTDVTTIENYINHFSDLLKEFETFVRQTQSSISEWFDAFENFCRFCQIFQELECQVKKTESKIKPLREKENDLTKEICSHTDAIQYRKKIEAYIQPLLDLRIDQIEN